jgi:TetR/AcrR family transcriptional regulator, regulator of cefoperazone and chloramphenicol sensitivity
MKTNATHAETRQALLQAAGAAFAQRGYRDTTVRDICQRAGANVAAVNYHFGDKRHLYLEVVRTAHAQAQAKYPFDLVAKGRAQPSARLRAFIRALLFRLFDTGPAAWMGRLMAMEMINPSEVLDTLVEERIRPMAQSLRAIVQELAGPDTDAKAVRLCGFSIVSQCLFYGHCRAVVARLDPEQKFEPADLEHLADHITRFSLAGLRPPAHRSSNRPGP